MTGVRRFWSSRTGWPKGVLRFGQADKVAQVVREILVQVDRVAQGVQEILVQVDRVA